MEIKKEKRKAGLYPLKSEPRKRKILSFDIETANNNKTFVLGCVYSDEYKKSFKNKKDLINDILNNRIYRNAWIYATNLSFDLFLLWIPKDAFKILSIIERQALIISAKTYISYSTKEFVHPEIYKKLCHDSKDPDKTKKDYYCVTFCDSIALFPASVEELGKCIGLQKGSSEYMGKIPKTKAQWQDLETYCFRDCEITYKFVKWFEDHLNTLGASLKLTIGSCAMDLFRRKYLKFPIYQEPRKNILFCYGAYYGGMTQIFKRGHFSTSKGHAKIKTYDITSLYPAMMSKNTFPYPNSEFYEHVLESDIMNFEGVCEIELDCPKDVYMPILPVKTDKLRFPVGYIKGKYDFHSIRYAIAKQGYKILNIGQGIVYKDNFTPFRSFVEDCFNLRRKFQSEKNNAEKIVKVIMNSLYGKFGFNFWNKESLIASECFDYDLLKTHSVENYLPDGSILKLRTSVNSKIPAYVFPILSIYVTSYGRTYMTDKMHEIGENRIIYIDTDGVKTDRDINTERGAELGEFKLEDIYEDFIGIKPKMYGYLTTEQKQRVRIKGLPYKNIGSKDPLICFNEFKSMAEIKTIKKDYTYFRKLRSSLNKNLQINEMIINNKSFTFEDDKRTWKDLFNMSEIQESTPLILNKLDYVPKKLKYSVVFAKLQ